MIEETLAAVKGSCAGEKFPGVLTARVIDVNDPLMLGRVQVQLPNIDAVDLQPWARIAVPMAGMTHGSYFIPNMGDEVLVAFENGSMTAPYIIGSLWTALNRPPISTPQRQVRAIRTLTGNQIVIQETPSSITIQTAPTAPEALPTPPSPVGPHTSLQVAAAGVTAYTPVQVDIQVGLTSKVMVTPETITLTQGPSSIMLSKGGVQITGPSVNIQAQGVVIINGKAVLIN